MDRPVPIHDFKPGEELTAARLTELVAALNRVRFMTGDGERIVVEPHADTLMIRGIDTGQAGATVSRFKVQAIHTDYLTCRSWDGTTLGSIDVNIAMPWDLRRTPFDGQTVNGVTYTYTTDIQRTATDGTNTETHVITPPYFADAEIYAARGLVGGAGVTVDGAALAWIDLNLAGRAWAVKAT